MCEYQIWTDRNSYCLLTGMTCVMPYVSNEDDCAIRSKVVEEIMDLNVL